MAILLAPLAPLASQAALAIGKGALTRAVTRSLVSGAAFQAGAEIVAQIAEWARSVDGTFDTTETSDTSDVDGCRESGTFGQLEYFDGITWKFAGQKGSQTLTAQTVAILETSNSAGEGGTAYGFCKIRTLNYGEAEIIDGDGSPEMASQMKWRIATDDCIESGPGPGSDPGPIQLPPLQSGDCIINPTFYGFLGRENGSGNLEPVFLMEPAAVTRAGGGVITGGCNFQPTIVVGGGGDGHEPPINIPAPNWPTASDPWWEYIVEGLTGAVVEDIYSSIQEALFGQLDPASFTLVAPCNQNEAGDPETFTVNFPQQNYQSRMEAWQIASAALLQQHLNWKTPICRDRPKLEGNWRTISFRSTQSSPYGKSCLRKRFRYRSMSGFGLGELVDHWKDFTWTTGPVCVTHKGHTWGTPQVWAATADEGKRVIQHAAREAGFDADQIGEWGISNSASPRYGVSLPVKVDTTGGYYWITARDGASERPIVALTSDI